MIYNQDGTSKGRSKAGFENCPVDLNTIMRRMIKDDVLCKLLVHDKPSALTDRVTTSAEKQALINNNIRIIPTLEKDDIMESYIIIQFDNFTPTSNPEFRGKFLLFDVICHKDLWLLEGGALRPYSIMSRIDNLVGDSKLSGIGPTNFVTTNQLLVSPSMLGFSMVYQVEDFK